MIFWISSDCARNCQFLSLSSSQPTFAAVSDDGFQLSCIFRFFWRFLIVRVLLSVDYMAIALPDVSESVGRTGLRFLFTKISCRRDHKEVSMP